MIRLLRVWWAKARMHNLANLENELRGEAHAYFECSRYDEAGCLFRRARELSLERAALRRRIHHLEMGRA